jgi:recombinational DNA repair protein (RecF pathway)
MTEPGDTGGDCSRCGEPYTLIGESNRVYGCICRECGLIELMHTQEVTGGKHIPKEELQE